MIGEGLRKVWIVYQQDYPPDRGPPTFLAAYDGENAEESAVALAELVRRTNPSGDIKTEAVPVWPLLHLAT